MSMEPVLHSFSYCLDFLREQVADIDPPNMVAQPNGIVNHPAWVIGHLTFSCQALGGEIGMPEWLPNSWPDLFGTGSVPVADATLYEPKDQAIALLDDEASGLVVSVLVSRTDTSFYLKRIAAGAPEEPLSPEEQQAMSRALQQ